MKYITQYSEISCVDDSGNEIGKVTFPETEKGVFDIRHTKVSENMQGRGIAAGLVRRAIAEIFLRGGEVRASCSYAEDYIRKHGLRPAVICHMVTSIDGKVTGDFLYSEKGIAVSEVYYEINRRIKGDAFACGRITMESSFTNGFRPDLSEFEGAAVPKGDFIARKHGYYAVSFDTLGKVGWTDSLIHDDDEGYDNCHIIEVITENTPEKMLAYYRKIGVSYIFAGREQTDIKLALNKLYSAFGIKKLLLEGGSIINGAFLREGLVDGLSIVTAPIIARSGDKPLFEGADMNEFQLLSSEVTDNGAVWSMYGV